MTLQEVRAFLDRERGSGKWRQVADAAGVHYLTVARLARGTYDGRVTTLERLSAAIKAVEQSTKEPA